MSSSDHYIFDSSLMSEDITSPMLTKKNIYILDSNATSDYQGQITWDFSQISNSFLWADFKSGVFEIPVTILVENTDAGVIADMSAVINSFFCGLKNGSHHLINSINVNVNNTSVISLTNFLNHYVSYRLMTELSQDDQKKLGATQFFSPDSSTSFHYASTQDGPGFTNNRPNPNVAENYSTQAFKFSQNAGFGDRLQNVLDFGANVTDAFYKQTINTTAKCTQNGISYFVTDTNKAYFNILATIRLRDICDLFEQLPLVRGTYVNMVMNLNTSRQTLTYVKNTQTLTASSVTITAGQTNPLLIASASANQPNNWLDSIAGGTTAQLEVALGVGTAKTSSGASYTNTLLGGRCRFYVDLYQLNPLYEERYLSLKTKEVHYTDIYTYLYQNQIAAGATFNFLATNGISRPRSVIVIPYVSKASNGTLTTVPIYQSPFASEPATTSCVPITAWNVLVSGTAIFQMDEQYDFTQWLEELSRANAVNGGQSNGFTSGLLSQKDFQYGYRYLVADLSRRLPQDDIARSIEIRGTNNTNVAIDLLVIVEYDRKLNLDLSSGSITTTF